jgi:ParB/RepB/Spo0J family partition protein
MASKRNTEKNAAAAIVESAGTLTILRASQIDFESFQNVRSAGWEKEQSSEVGDGSSFPTLKLSIATVGQKDPITVRPKAKVGRDGYEYECIKGFQRGTAIKQIGAERKPEPDLDPVIKVIIKDLSDLEALEECTYENTARNNLTPADTAAAAVRLLDAFKAAGNEISVNALAERMGKNQSWLNSLVLIARKGGKVFDMWQTERKVSVPANVMTSLLKQCTAGEGAAAVVDIDAAEKLYGEVQKNKGKLPSTRTPDVLKSANAGAKAAGNLLGRLQAAGHITLSAELQGATTTALLVSCEINIQGLTAEQLRGVCNTLTAERIKALAAATEAASKAGVSSEPVKRRAGKGSKDAAAN